MEIAILVFFLAILGGVLFLLALIYFLVRRFKKSRPVNRNFSGTTSYITDDTRPRNDDFLASSVYVASNEMSSDNSTFENQTTHLPRETAHDAADSGGHAASHSHHGDTHHADSSWSINESGTSFDSNPSYDSSSSSDSGSSSSDSGGGSSSSSD